jgi:WS/DGAT/MGAT family acyltransferase
MAAKPLNPLDASWLLVESRETPMHVGGLLVFSLPEKAPADYMQKLMALFRASTHCAPPWNQRLRGPGLEGLRPVWERETDIDLEHHVRHSALPQPGGERELGQLIARLHSQPLDLKRPPWECTLIEGLAGARFALYIKMHHSLIDGISGMKLLARSMASDPVKSRRLKPFWEIGIAPPKRGRSRKRSESPPPTVAEIVNSVVEGLKLQLDSLPNVARAFLGMASAFAKPEETLKIPFDTPLSILNTRITGQRRFATQLFEIPRLKALAERAGATLNDIVLALCGTALRRFLLELNELPDKPLTTGIPVSVRPKDDENTGNAITFIIATLGTDIADARERVEAIKASTRRAKQHLQELPRHALMQYTVLLMAPYMLSLLTGIGGRTRPMFNVTISNVPGPEGTLWFRGARLEATYPVSLVSHGQALNITCHGYDGRLAFGFTACRDALPSMQRLAPYTGEALTELEAAYAEAPSAPPKPRLKRRAGV